ncbi:hypothetical protein QZH41_006916 [Actinostola sp. cb2023]|nr:hypothetical protein QZH41_006916 [Actinostola sp. cb2023]
MFSRCLASNASRQEEKKSLINAVVDKNILSVYWPDGDARFHHVWLRHHCPCHQCLNPTTKQRTIDMALIPDQVRPQQVNLTSNGLQIIWDDDGHETCYDGSWLKENAYDGSFVERRRVNGFGTIANESDMTLWNRGILASKPPQEFSYSDILGNREEVLRESLNSIFRYGFIFVNETPTDEESTLKICQEIVGPIRETPEGRVYVIENKGLCNSDLSYFSSALHGHTDFTFYKDPPGIQAMHCTHHHGTGGMSLLVDGFRAAKTLYEEDAQAFKILASTELRFGSTHHCIEGHGTILELDPFTKELMRVRWNNSRVNIKLSFDEMERFYQAVRLYGSIVRREENEL